MNRKPVRAPLRTAAIRIGVVLLLVSSLYLTCGLVGWMPLEMEMIAWNNVRIVSGVAITGCLMAAIGFGDE